MRSAATLRSNISPSPLRWKRCVTYVRALIGPSTLATFDGLPVPTVEPERTVWVGRARSVWVEGGRAFRLSRSRCSIGDTLEMIGARRNKKRPPLGPFRVAGAGFEPATSGL